MSEVKVGERAPSFTLLDQDGKPLVLDEALGKGAVVVFFYPKDDTPGCTTEVCSFRDSSAELVAAGATVVGISSDGVASHKKFAAKHELPYRLLADEGGKVREQFGVPRGMFGLLDGRVTYVLDDQGIVRHRFEAMLRAGKHADEAIATVKKLRAA
jgi:peroxiredoxin Q/BCP